MTRTTAGVRLPIMHRRNVRSSRRRRSAHTEKAMLTMPNNKRCPVCGSSFRGGERQINDKPKCGHRAALMRNAATRRSTRAARYKRYLLLGGSSRPV